MLFRSKQAQQAQFFKNLSLMGGLLLASVDTAGKPTTLIDFTIPTDGFESPWGMAKFVLFHDGARVPEPPTSLEALLAWAEAYPGRFTYPAPPDFIGSTFLKHVLYAAVADPDRLQEPVAGEEFAEVAAPVWARLDRVRPHLWRGGAAYPSSGQALHQLLDDGEVDFSMAFNPAEASSLILEGRLPETVRSFVFEEGSIANTHFVAIPFNAAHKEGAMVVANFLLADEINRTPPKTQASLLEAMEERQVSVDGTKTYFDTNVSTHHHFYLEHNHELVDIPDPNLVLSKMPDVPEGYEISRVDMVVRLRKKR